MTIRFSLQDSEAADPIGKVAAALHRTRRCVVVTGAGISVSGGIPDFRSADGLYNLVKAKYPTAVVKGKDLFDAALFRDPTSTSLFYTFMAELKTVVSRAEITPTHRFVKQLDVDHKLLRCYTQNIDGLELRLEMSSDLNDKQAARIVQLHGDLDNVICTMCKSKYPFDDPKSEFFREGSPPPCPECQIMQTVRIVAGKRSVTVGTLRPNIVLYNEHHAKGEQIAGLTAYDVKKRPDLLIVMGTSLKVVGIKRLVKDLAKSVHETKNGIVVFVNNTEVGKEWDGIFDYHIVGATDDVVTRLNVEVECLQAAADARHKRLAEKKETKGLKETTSRPSEVIKVEVEDMVEVDIISLDDPRKREAKGQGGRQSKKRKTIEKDGGDTVVSLPSMPSLLREESGVTENGAGTTKNMHVEVEIVVRPTLAAGADTTLKDKPNAWRKTMKAAIDRNQTKLVAKATQPSVQRANAPASKTKVRKTAESKASVQTTLSSLGLRSTKPRLTNNSQCAALGNPYEKSMPTMKRKSARLNARAAETSIEA
ncbi:DHS-like NAD/FAD-binding domain-containing protein [Powellomyces hirtus]|nr:DHS-like NAD/FAD-binding domain-containing protein [Powellomyces hirtus]